MDAAIYLVRHCHAVGQGQESEAPLSAEGVLQSERLAQWFGERPIERIISSPYLRAYQTAQPLAKRYGLSIQADVRLQERILSTQSLSDWRERLAASFDDLDLCLPGGESCRTAMARGRAVLEEILCEGIQTTVVVTHGNLLTLLLKSFEASIGFDHWQRLTNPDVYCLSFRDGLPQSERLWSTEANL